MLVALAGGCASESTVRKYVPEIITPYRIDIQQGNFITPDMVEKLAVGQTRDQVRFILGTPVLNDVFHAQRWDYVFRYSKGWNQPERRKLVVFFDGAGKLERWDAELPAAPASEKAPPPGAAATPPPGAPTGPTKVQPVTPDATTPLPAGTPDAPAAGRATVVREMNPWPN